MKKFLIAMSAIIAVSVSAFGADSIKIVVDGSTLSFNGQGPVIKDERTLVPLRGIFEALGADVQWDDENKIVTAVNENDTVIMKIGENIFTVNGESRHLDTAAEIIGESTMIPARAVAEAFGADVQWDEVSKTITILSLKGENSIVKEIKADDGKVLMISRASYVQFDNPENDSKISALNNDLKVNAQKVVDDFIMVYGDDSRELYKEEPEYLHFPYEGIYSSKIVYNKDGIVSVITEIYQNTGGAHPSGGQLSETYSLTEGRKLRVEELSGKSRDETLAAAKEAFEVLIDKNPENFFSDAKEYLKVGMEDVGFYATDKGICFYMNEYQIAPYAAGTISVIVDFN